MLLSLVLTFVATVSAFASEANLMLPDLSSVSFLGGISGAALLKLGLLVCVFGLIFGFIQFKSIKNLPVHKSMLEVSELIYETCKTYLVTQGKFIIILEVLLAVIIAVYFANTGFEFYKIAIIILCSIIGILGSYAVAWFGMRINTFANSRAAFASLKGKPFPTFAIPLKSGMSIGMLLISIELFVMLIILVFVPGNLAGPCFIGFAIGESLGASVLRIAGGIFTKIADIGSDLMKIVFNIKEDDARNPGVIADCTGDNAGDSVGPTADGFETYGVTGVALVTFVVLAVREPQTQVKLLVWIFVMRLMMLIASAVSYWINGALAKAKYGNADKMNFEAPLTSLVWITSVVSVILTFVVSNLIIGDLANGLWWKLSIIITCGTMAGAIIPEVVKIFTSTTSSFVKNVVNSSKNGGASLNILAGLTSGNFSAYWMGLVIILLMAIAYAISSLTGFSELMSYPAVFAFGLVAFGFLGMGPVTIAVDSYGPVTDNAQSVYELSLIENVPNIKEEIKKDFGFEPNFDKSKITLEENDGAGNTFKATAKPVLIGTAVVGATTMIFSIIFTLMNERGISAVSESLSLLHAPFLLGLIAGGAVIYWFTGASNHAVTSGAYKAVEYIKDNMKLDGVTKASTEQSKKVVEICTQYAQKGMFNLFLVIFFSTIAFAFIEPYFFIGYLISIALFGLFQAIFMANAGGAWDNAKKIVEVDMREKGSELHKATVVGDTVGDPFKDTSSVALNPIIKFTTLFGLLALELALVVPSTISIVCAIVFFVISLVFVVKSFTSMLIK
ncbi:sodium-translocating pyrophosphatase [Candidatus Ruminimicrobium bovinum]|uniref:sodium-translocating pyrophosphatase n=1 Tax=Candidatus Ruminimicrobium bovinum TaxID=3242779 RepID=UPI0039B8482A